MHFAHKLLDKKTSPSSLHEGLEFFFAHTRNPGKITFDLCANVLTIRPDVIRMRIQYEWWLRGTLFTGPFDFAAVGVPHIMGGEILYHAGPLGNILSREIWVQPGISADELFSYVQSAYPDIKIQRIVEAIDVLADKFLISKNNGFYFTGRNPMLMNMNAASYLPSNRSSGGSVHWTRLFAMLP